MLLQVQVPEGLYAGEPMVIDYNGQEFTITIPDGLQGGDLLDVDLPVTAANTPNTVMVVVPDGCEDGFFTVDFDGRTFDVGVPKGCHAGDEIEVEVPAEPEEPQHQQRLVGRRSREEFPEDSQQRLVGRRSREDSPTPAFSAAALIGRRVELCRLVSKGILNGRKGFVRSYNAESDELAITVDGLGPDLVVRSENVFELPEDDEPDPDNDEPPEAPPAGLYYVGDRVLVERSNGSTSVATVVEYDEVFESYVLDVGRGVLKYGVEESYIRPYESSNEWAGPAQRIDGRWEGYFVGRRVRIPAMMNSSDDDDKNGEIRGYDHRTNFYHIELDSGVVRKTVLFKQIRVMLPSSFWEE